MYLLAHKSTATSLPISVDADAEAAGRPFRSGGGIFFNYVSQELSPSYNLAKGDAYQRSTCKTLIEDKDIMEKDMYQPLHEKFEGCAPCPSSSALYPLTLQLCSLFDKRQEINKSTKPLKQRISESRGYAREARLLSHDMQVSSHNFLALC